MDLDKLLYAVGWGSWLAAAASALLWIGKVLRLFDPELELLIPFIIFILTILVTLLLKIGRIQGRIERTPP